MDRIIMPFLLLAVSAGLFFSYIMPTYDVVIALQEQEDRVDLTVEKTAAYQSKIDELTVKLDNIPLTDRERLVQFLGAKKSDPVRTTVLLDTLARRSNVRIHEFTLPQGPMRGSAVDVMWAQYGITCFGEYDDLKSFVLAMERSLTLLEVRSFSLDRSEAAESAPNVELKSTIIFDTPYLDAAL